MYLPAGADALGPLMHAWGAVYDADPATGEPAREYLGIGRLFGHVRRERHSIAEALTEPVSLPEYPRCPDCGGRIEWAEAGGVPGSRRCAGMTLPDLPAAGMAADPPGVTSDREAGCGSRYVDTRFGLASPVPEGET